jgi:hypothetical protein
MSDTFDITKVSAERARRGRPPKPKNPVVTPVSIAVPGESIAPVEEKTISIIAPDKPEPQPTFIAPKEMDPLEEAVFGKTVVEDAEPKRPPREISERTREEIERGKRALSRL